jgi:prepilin-type N-terminal cleavage/methylation domain-containing protein
MTVSVAQTRQCSKAQAGFTLVEMLVVVSIIVLLIAMLLPALGKSREAAKRSVCATQLTQIYQAVTNYSLDDHGRYPGGNATVYPGHGLGSTYSVVQPRPYGLAFVVITDYLPPSLMYCPSWSHPFNQLGVVDTPGEDPWFAPGDMGGWPAGGEAGPRKHRGISYHYRSSLGSTVNRPPSVKRDGGDTPIIADHFVRREVLYGRDYGHGDGYNAVMLGGGVRWFDDPGGAYMNQMQPAGGGITNGQWAYQEVIWEQFFEQ